jgi:hypothetical protein
MKFLLAYLLLSLAITGCQFGPKIEHFEQARRPEGTTVSIELLRSGITEGGRIEGELLEVQEEGLLLNTREAREGGVVKRHLVFVPYTVVQFVGIEQLNVRMWMEEDTGAEGDARPRSRERDRETLRLLSRFPQGLSAPLLEALLAAEGQTNVEVIGGD